MAVLSAADERRIEQTIGKVEQTTAGEVVVATVACSGAYGGLRAALAGVWTVMVAATVLSFWPDAPTLWLLLAQLPAAGVFYWAAGLGPLLRLIVPATVAEAAAQQRAMQLFVQHGVHDTRDKSGLLLMISERERRVVLLGDAGIHLRVTTDGWQSHVGHIVAGIRAGRAGDAVVEVLERLGAVLAEHFPPRPDDINELPDRVIHH